MFEPYGPFNIQSGKVSKGPADDTGETADHTQWFEAPPDRFFVEDSWKIKMISGHGKNASIQVEQKKRTSVEITLPNGDKIKTPLCVAFLVRAHAETGSGYSPDVVTAWVEGEVSALLQEYS